MTENQKKLMVAIFIKFQDDLGFIMNLFSYFYFILLVCMVYTSKHTKAKALSLIHGLKR